MTYDELVEILGAMGVKNFSLTGDSHLKLHCLFQETRHESGYDRHPSSTISFNRRSWFKCYTCQTQGWFSDILRERAVYAIGRGYTQLAEKVEKLEKSAGRIIQPPVEKQHNYGAQLKQLLKNDFSPEAIEMMESRSVDPEFARRQFKVCLIPKGTQLDGMKEPAKSDAIFFPAFVRTNDLRLRCIGGQARSTNPNAKFYYCPFPFRGRGVLYGQHLRDRIYGQNVFLEEGMFDVIHTWQVGFPALGALGTGFSGAAAAAMRKLRPKHVFIFMDPDKPGQKAADKAAKALEFEEVPSTICRHHVDPKHCEAEIFQGFLENLE